MDVPVMLLLSLLPALCDTAFTKNLALGASAVQSSTYTSFGVASGAVDGNRDTNEMLCTRTTIQDDPWWRVDLKKVSQISRITITNGGEQMSDAEICIGNGLTNNGNDNHVAVMELFIPSGGTKTFDFNPVEGRYVNIFLPGMNRTLSLCEVEVFAEIVATCVPGNLALGAEAVQSSTLSGYNAQKAVDGNRDLVVEHGSCSVTGDDKLSWWRVDLKKVYQIRKVTITAKMHNPHWPVGWSLIHIGKNDSNINPIAAPLQNIPDGGTKTVEFEPVNGRYVSIVALSSDYLCLCEVEVFC